ncbi:Actin cross-linking toxin VgrG1 [Myxococcaceae bacterium]|nr:Actin cross-linking toxin VgrG1 [Myxococcaceae bacterium]
MTGNLLDLLLPPRGPASDRIYGVVVGIVTNNQDPDGLGRVKLRFPWLSDDVESEWARIAVLMAGPERGSYFLPEVEDEVLVAFEQGDVRFPFVLGALWNGKDKPPESNQDGENNKRLIKSRSGHIVRLDDTDGGEKIEILDKSGKNSLVIDTAANTLTLKADSDIVLESAQGKVVIKGQSIEIQSTAQDIKIESSANLDVKGGAQTNIKGSLVNIN